MTKTTLRTSVTHEIKRRVRSRALVPGDRLPSIRAFAREQNLSPSTVSEAYDLLVAEGVIFARQGSGFYVADRTQPFAVAETGPQLDRSVDPLWVARQSIDTGENIEKPGCGWLPADWMPVDSLRRAMRKQATFENHVLTNYGNAQGHIELRQHIAQQGDPTDPNAVLLTGSGSQALDLICRLMLRPGDTVLIDDPCYFNFNALLRAHQINIVSVPFTTNGPDLDHFARILTREKPRLYLTNSALHNPTGATISQTTAQGVLSLAQSHDLLIVEDDIFSEFESTPSPRLAGLDGMQRVLRIGSFSKTLSASLRCGYIIARPDWIKALTDLQVATNFGGPSPFVSSILHAALTDGSYRKHMATLHKRLGLVRTEAITKLETIGIKPTIQPRGGFYLWCELPARTDAAKIAQAALKQDLVLAPGNVFSASQSKTSFMRFNVSQMQNDRCYEILNTLLNET